MDLILNFNDHAQQIVLPGEEFFDVLQGRAASGTLDLPIYAASVLRRNKT
jgi:hypothetical protein